MKRICGIAKRVSFEVAIFEIAQSAANKLPVP